MQLCPDADDNDLILDLNGGPVRTSLLAPDQREIWLSETTVGGGGIIEKIQQIYREDPRSFFELLDFNLSPGDYETMDNNVWHLLQTMVNPTSSLPACMNYHSVSMPLPVVSPARLTSNYNKLAKGSTTWRVGV